MENLPQLPQNFWAFLGLVVLGLFWVVVKPLLSKFLEMVDRMMAHQADMTKTLGNHFADDAKTQSMILNALETIAKKLVG